MSDTEATLTPRQIELIKEIREIAKILGKTPTLPVLDANPDWPSRGTIRYHFRNYTELLRLAELPAPPCTRRWSTKVMMDLLKDFILALGRIPSQSEVRENPSLPSDEIYLSIYPDWESVIGALGFSLNWCSERKREWLISGLWNKYRELDYRPPGTRDIQMDPEMEKPWVYVQIFGDLRYAWRAAGIWDDYCQRQKKEIVETILRLHKETGKTPRLRDPGMPNEHLIHKVCGCSYAELIVGLGLKPNYRHYTRKELIAQLKQKSQKLGRSPSVKEIEADPEMASPQTFRKEFKNVTKALKAAGLPPAPRLYAGGVAKRTRKGGSQIKSE